MDERLRFVAKLLEGEAMSERMPRVRHLPQDRLQDLQSLQGIPPSLLSSSDSVTAACRTPSVPTTACHSPAPMRCSTSPSCRCGGCAWACRSSGSLPRLRKEAMEAAELVVAVQGQLLKALQDVAGHEGATKQLGALVQLPSSFK
jgi:hypothetical protein